MDDMKRLPDVAALVGQDVTIHIDAFSLFAVVSAAQLATRHPQFPASMRPHIGAFIEGSQSALPTVADIIEAGNHEAKDV